LKKLECSKQRRCAAASHLHAKTTGRRQLQTRLDPPNPDLRRQCPATALSSSRPSSSRPAATELPPQGAPRLRRGSSASTKAPPIRLAASPCPCPCPWPLVNQKFRHEEQHIFSFTQVLNLRRTLGSNPRSTAGATPPPYPPAGRRLDQASTKPYLLHH